MPCFKTSSSLNEYPFPPQGIGLDDTFIITGSYFYRLRAFQTHLPAVTAKGREEVRTRPLLSAHFSLDGQIVIDETFREGESLPRAAVTAIETKSINCQTEEEIVVQRIHDTLEEVGLSISLTTLTTTFAFLLGCISSIPGIQWLCLYACSTVVFDFLFQITLFVAFIVLDERRVRRISPPGDRAHPDASESQEDVLKIKPSQSQETGGEFFMDRFMKWYAQQLMTPIVKVLVIGAFMTMLAYNMWSTTLLEQQFNIEGTV